MSAQYQASASAVASAVAGGASASAAASAGVQLSFSSQMAASLTTIFTPPPACRTPFAFDGDCYNEFECDGSYIPILYLPSSENPRGTSIQCYPKITTYNDGYVDGVFDYSPGLFCPDGMTTITSIADAFLCCPSGLTYSYDGHSDWCDATITMGEALLGQWKDNSASIASTTSFSAADNMTLYASAIPVYLTRVGSGTFANIPSQSIPPASGETTTPGASTPGEMSSETSTSNSPRCRRDNCQTTTTTQAGVGGGSMPIINDGSKSSDQENLKIGVGVGVGVGGAVILSLAALSYFLLRRYRQLRLLNNSQVLYIPPTKPTGDDEGGVQEIQQIYQKKPPPELPVPAPWVELEGTQVEDRGPGIWVWKPELEGTAGVPGAKGVYVRKKSELEAKYYGANAALGTGIVVYTESPILGESFADPRYPAPTAGNSQAYA